MHTPNPPHRFSAVYPLLSLALFCAAPPAEGAPSVTRLSLSAVDGLDSKIVRRMDTITGSLDEVDTLLASKKLDQAKEALEAANKEMAKIHSWYGGKFDENDADFVALTARLAASTTKVTGSAPPVEKKTEKVEPDSGAAKPLNGKVARRVQTISDHLDEVDKHVAGQDLKQASGSLNAARKEMSKIMDWHKGQFDEQHPDFLAISDRLEKTISKVEGDGGLGAQAGNMAEELGGIISVLDTANSDLNGALDDIRQQGQAFDRADTPEELAEVVAGTRQSVERATAIHAAATQTVRGFHTQFPDLKTLENLVADGLGAIGTLEYVETFQERWDRTRSSRLSRFLPTDISDNLAAFARAKTNSDFRDNAIINAELMIDRLERMKGFATALVGTGEQVSSEMKAHAESTKALDTQLGTLRLAVAEARGQEADERTLRLGSARFPKATLTGGEWSGVEATMGGLFEAYTKDKTVKRVTVHSAWDQRTEARWRNDTWIVGTYRYVGGTLLAELPDGRYRVYRVSFRKTLGGDGEFGPLEVFGIGHSFEILAENITK